MANKLPPVIRVASERLLNPEEAAEFIGVSKSTIQRLVKTHQIPHLKVGPKGLIRFKSSDLLEAFSVKVPKR